MTSSEKLEQFVNRNPQYSFEKGRIDGYYFNPKYVLSDNKAFSMYPKGQTWSKVFVLPLTVSYATLEAVIKESI